MKLCDKATTAIATTTTLQPLSLEIRRRIERDIVGVVATDLIAEKSEKSLHAREPKDPVPQKLMDFKIDRALRP